MIKILLLKWVIQKERTAEGKEEQRAVNPKVVFCVHHIIKQIPWQKNFLLCF